MPELVDVASHFDDVSINDAYTGSFAFYGQFSSFDESSPDGSVTKKRSLSVRPGTVIPTRKAINFFDETWIVGDGNTDALQNVAVRKAYWMKKSTGLYTRLTPAQVCSGAAGTTLHGSIGYLKDTVNGVSDAEYDPFWDLYTALDEGTLRGQFFKLGSTYFRVRGVHDEASGFTLAQCDAIEPGNVLSVTVSSAGAYDPITDTYAGSSSVVTGILLEPSKFYRYATKADDKYNSGDMTMILQVAPAVNSTVVASGITWRVLDVQAEIDAYALHIRRP